MEGTATPFDRVRLELALSAAGLGSFDWDPLTGELHWDERLMEMFGYAPEGFDPHIDSFTARVHPDDREAVAERLRRALEEDEDFVMEYRIVLPDGRIRWISARGRAVPLERGRVRLLGLAFDCTEVRDVQKQVVRTLESMGDAFFSLDREWRFTYVNVQAEKLLGRTRQELVGRNVWEEYPEAVGAEFEREYKRAAREREAVSFEAYYPAPLDTWFEVRAFPGDDGLAVYFHDVTQRKLEEVERQRMRKAEEAANRRLEVLADSSGRLSALLDPERILDALTEILVPELGTWVVVMLREDQVWRLHGEEGGDRCILKVVRCAHSDPARAVRLREVAERTQLRTDDPEGVGKVVRTGEVLNIRDVAELMAETPPEERDADALDVLDQNVLVVPLATQDEVLGAITVTSDDPYLSLDETLLSDLARRAAVALENAVLYRSEQRTALALQRSLMPMVPRKLPGMEVATRYIPGTRGAEIGGDWYEVLPRRDGKVGIVIGDVMGHSVRAAAQMGQLRLAVATLLLQGQEPAEILTALSSDVSSLLELQLATVLVGVYDNDTRKLAVATAGHPPPLLRTPEEEPAYLWIEPGPPLGSGEYQYSQEEMLVPEGADVVLYTDGLVESRERGMEEDLERLRTALQRTPSGSRPERICDALLDGVERSRGGPDDLAVMVVRHH